MNFSFNKIIKWASKLIYNCYHWIIVKIVGDDIIVDHNCNILPENLYDIYYHFKILENEDKINGIQIGKFEYPSSFTMIILNTDYKIKIFKMNYKTYTILYNNNISINTTQMEHPTYGSLENEIYTLNVKVNMVTFNGV